MSNVYTDLRERPQIDDTRPLISVIMPARNAEAYVEEAIASVLEQTLPEIELIVVDDRSNDSTYAIVSRLAQADPRLRLLEGTGRGPGAARNHALAGARGDWVALVDADDRIAPTRLASLLNLAVTAKAQIAADNLLAFYTDGSLSHLWLENAQWREVTEVRLKDLIAPQQIEGRDLGYLKPLLDLGWIRKQEINYNEDLSIGEDFDFVARALVRGARYVFSPEAGYHYRRHSASTSYRISVAQLDAMIHAAESLAADVSGTGEQLTLYARIVELRLDRRFATLVNDFKRGRALALAEAAREPGLRRRLLAAAHGGLRRRLRTWLPNTHPPRLV